MSLEERKKSYFYNMRRYHNHIKREMYNSVKGANSLLDIGSGKGGDLQKFIDNKIQYIVGYDISEESVKEAKRRAMQFPEAKNYKFNVLDLRTNEIKSENQFSIVTSMFSFHYFFESKSTFKTVMKSITNNLVNGGLFMGTFFDGDLVKKYIQEKNQSKEFKLTLKHDDPKELFGNTLSVMISDTVLNETTDEYIVNFEMFVREMKKYNFELLDTKTFDKFDYKQFKLKPLEKQVSFLNRTFVFQLKK